MAGIVMAVTIGKAALVDAACDDVAEAELDGPTMVTGTVIVYMAPVAADWTVKTIGRVSPMSAVDGSKVIWSDTVVEMAAKVALLDRMTSAELCKYGVKEMTVFRPAGIVIAVMLGAALDVAVALAELDPITVTRTSTVYSAPVLVDSTVKITGRVRPISTDGGSKVIWPATVAEMVAKVALLDRMVSEELRKYEVKEMTVFTLAGIVTAVILGAAVEVAVVLAEVDPMTVTRTVTIYVEPVAADSTVKMTGRVTPISTDGGSNVI